MKAKIEFAQQYLDGQAARAPLASFLPGYTGMSPQEQMHADLERRAPAIQAQRAAVAQRQAEDDDVVDAEIVDD